MAEFSWGAHQLKNLAPFVSYCLDGIILRNASLKPIFSVTPYGTPFILLNLFCHLSIQTAGFMAQLRVFPII